MADYIIRYTETGYELLCSACHEGKPCPDPYSKGITHVNLNLCDLCEALEFHNPENTPELIHKPYCDCVWSNTCTDRGNWRKLHASRRLNNNIAQPKNGFIKLKIRKI